MKKEEYIAKYGEVAYKKRLEKNRAWDKANRRRRCAISQKWQSNNPEKRKAYNRLKYPERQLERRKGGKYHKKLLKYQQIGLPGERHKIRMKHGYQYRPYKRIIAPDSQIHHEWIPQTAKYRGVALVEKDPHQYGIIDVIQILDGKITLLTEEEIKNFIP